ncbi:MAG: DUF45 domain-containing protein [Gammaproteobacteria bacterium]
MFTYLDTTVRERLINQGKLKRLNTKGEEIDAERARLEEPALDLLGPIPLPLHLDDIDVTTDWYAFVRHTELAKVDELATELREHAGERYFSMLASFMAVNSVLLVGDPQSNDSPLVRVHSSCLTGDVFGSLRCECGPQLALALERIREDPAGGIVVYMSGHEGRGIGLWAKAATYVLQDAGENTYQANRSLGLPDDSRDFTDAAAILRYFLDPPQPGHNLSTSSTIAMCPAAFEQLKLELPEEFVLELPARGLVRFVVERDHRRRTRVGIVIDPAGFVRLDVPRNADLEEIREIAREHARWIARRLAELADLGTYYVSPGFAPGELHHYLGAPYSLVLQRSAGEPHVELSNARLVVSSRRHDAATRDERR